MEEEIDFIFDSLNEANAGAIEHLTESLVKIRAGKATPSMVSSVSVDYYGSMTPLSQVANISTLDARTISVQPWEKAMLDEIAKGITNANLGLNPQNNGELIIINVPMLTEERRKEIVKMVKKISEAAKVSVRNHRRKINDDLKAAKNDKLISEDDMFKSQEEVQKITDEYVKKCDAVGDNKEKEIMEF